jgi:exodeoxyribonuclease VII small subunit
MERLVTKKKAPQLEQALQELETIVQQLEQGDLDLGTALATFEQGISLVKSSQDQLEQAKQKVSILLQNQNDLSQFKDGAKE